MRVIFGIGNPGIRYENTRHNAGFLLLDYFARKKSIQFYESDGEYFKAEGKISDQSFILIKPVTFVNKSGIAAKQIFEKFGLLPEDFLVICDDTNLNMYDLRVRLSGGDGGHNGLYSIIFDLMTDQFPRIRIGIGGSPKDISQSDYVLSSFSRDELNNYQKTFEKCSTLVQEFIIGGNKKMLEANSLLSKLENLNNLDD